MTLTEAIDALAAIVSRSLTYKPNATPATADGREIVARIADARLAAETIDRADLGDDLGPLGRPLTADQRAAHARAAVWALTGALGQTGFRNGLAADGRDEFDVAVRAMAQAVP
ncbi:hypothetical protein [Gordonia sp. NPDC003422]